MINFATHKNNQNPMKRLIYLSGLFLLTIASKAQNSNAILFTENGERFQVVLNGILQNSNPETNVKLTQLPADHYKCRIIFSETKLGFVDFNLFFNEQGNEVTWNIKKNNKGEYVVRYVSAVPLAEAPVAPPTQSVVIYSTTPPATTTTTTIQQTQTSGGSNDDDININLGVNANGQGGNISIHASGMDGNQNESGYSSTTTTTTTTHTVSSSGPGNTPPPPLQPVHVIYVSGYSGKIGCPVPLSAGEFNDMKETIRSKDFENTKLTISKQILKNNCMTASQVREIMGLFDFENTKLDFAKYAYDRTYDVGNYYKVNDAFEFESSVDDLNKYIGGR